jgi:hypothetical protein
MRFGVGFCLSTSSLLRRLGPSVLRRPAGRFLTLGSFGVLVAGGFCVLAQVWAALQFVLALERRFATGGRRTFASFVAASAWAARPGASGSAVGSVRQLFGARRVVGVFSLRRAAMRQFSSGFGFGWFSRSATLARFCQLSPVSGVYRSGTNQHNRATPGGANPSFNRTCFGVAAPGVISFSPGFATLAHAG